MKIAEYTTVSNGIETQIIGGVCLVYGGSSAYNAGYRVINHSWECSCGDINSDDRDQCFSCGKSK